MQSIHSKSARLAFWPPETDKTAGAHASTAKIEKATGRRYTAAGDDAGSDAGAQHDRCIDPESQPE